MEDVRDLKELQLDALRAVANIGAGHAATALSQMTNRTIMIAVPEVNVRALEDVTDLVGRGDEVMAAVLMHMMVDLSAAVLTSAYLNFGHARDFVFCVETAFRVENAAAPLVGHFLLLPDMP